MKPVPFEGSNRIYGADQPEYQPLPAFRAENDPQGAVITEWELTPEERVAIATGKNIRISMFTFNQPLSPILPYVDGVTFEEITKTPGGESIPTQNTMNTENTDPKETAEGSENTNTSNESNTENAGIASSNGENIDPGKTEISQSDGSENVVPAERGGEGDAGTTESLGADAERK